MKSQEQACQSLVAQQPWPVADDVFTLARCACAHCITKYSSLHRTVLLEYTKLQLGCINCYMHCYLHALSRCMQYGDASSCTCARGSCHHRGISTLVLLIINSPLILCAQKPGGHPDKGFTQPSLLDMNVNNIERLHAVCTIMHSHVQQLCYLV